MCLRQLETLFTDLLDAEADGDSVDSCEGYSLARGHRLRKGRSPESLDGNDGYVVPAVAMEAFDNAGQETAAADRNYDRIGPGSDSSNFVDDARIALPEDWV